MGMTTKRVTTSATTLAFEKFWAWLQAHANCILRAGTPEAVLLDHDDFHWHLAAEEEGTMLVQLVRGKDLVGELLVFSTEIAYVQGEPGEAEGEHVFECIIESEAAREVAYHFVMAHEYDEVEHPQSARKWTH
jgi:hypothetical protein